MSALVIVLIVAIALAAIAAVIGFGWSMIVRATTRIVLDEIAQRQRR
jgi:ABC-type anion transport system duplicated permease subunit